MIQGAMTLQTAGTDEHNEPTASVWFEPTWLGLEQPPPCADEASRAAMLAANAEVVAEAEHALERRGCRLFRRVAEFRERYSSPERARRAPRRATGSWPGWYGLTDLIAVALGAAEPQWVRDCWWHERERHALDWVQDARDAARIAVPDWRRVPAVERMIAAHDRWAAEHPNEPPTGYGITYEITRPGADPATVLQTASFVDMGLYLLGIERFLTILASDQALADALMERFLELSTSLTQHLLQVKPERFEGLLGFGGDATCMFSPRLYEHYGAKWDDRLFAWGHEVMGLSDTMPCNLHSCGPSAHLYDCWREHPRRANISTMQTRLIPGQVGRLREALPQTQLELTIHAPEFDVVAAPPTELGSLLLRSFREAQLRDVRICVIAHLQSEDHAPGFEASLEACFEAVEQARAEAREP